MIIAGHLSAGEALSGHYCAATEQAVRHFQASRGLRVHGLCDDSTWSALVEASWSLGDRVLFHTVPNLRGDDVAELQVVLARLGFDCGRVDGVYGPDTAAAVADFQRNCGLVIDGACGRDTIVALQRLSRHSGVGPGITTVRESEGLRRGSTGLHHHRIVVGHFGGVAPLVRALGRALRQRGAEVITLDDPDALSQAQAANRFEAEAYLGLEAKAVPGVDLAYYAVPRFVSRGGQSLAHHLSAHFQQLLSTSGPGVSVQGLRLPILRETRMTAVMATLGPVRFVLDHAADLSVSVADALDDWIRQPQSPPPKA